MVLSLKADGRASSCSRPCFKTIKDSKLLKLIKEDPGSVILNSR